MTPHQLRKSSTEQIQNDDEGLDGKTYISFGLVALVIALLPKWSTAVEALVYNHSDAISLGAFTGILCSWIWPRFSRGDSMQELFGYIGLLVCLVCTSWMYVIINPTF